MVRTSGLCGQCSHGPLIEREREAISSARTRRQSRGPSAERRPGTMRTEDEGTEVEGVGALSSRGPPQRGVNLGE